MEVTKAAVEARLAELEKAKEQHVANANACTGAIQDCQFWLAHLSKVESKKEPPKLEAVK